MIVQMREAKKHWTAIEIMAPTIATWKTNTYGFDRRSKFPKPEANL